MKYLNPKKDDPKLRLGSVYVIDQQRIIEITQTVSTPDLFSIIDQQREITQTVRGINKLNDVIDWELFRPELESLLGYDDRDLSKGGRPPFDPVFMLKVLVLQKYHNLSDEQTEFQIGDRFSFMQFLGLQPGDSVPDEKTIWDFKGLLDKDGRDGARKLFECFASQLSGEGMIAREGSIVDASFVDAPRARNTREQNAQIKSGERPEDFEADTAKGRQKDCDARWTKKNTETHYGYQNHVKVDAKSKLVVSYKSTAANVHDSQVLEDLIDDAMKRCLPTVRIHQNPATNACSKMAVKTSFSSKHSVGNRSLQRRLQGTSCAAVSGCAASISLGE